MLIEGKTAGFLLKPFYKTFVKDFYGSIINIYRLKKRGFEKSLFFCFHKVDL